MGFDSSARSPPTPPLHYGLNLANLGVQFGGEKSVKCRSRTKQGRDGSAQLEAVQVASETCLAPVMM
jgi:hypothetical protein